MKRPFSLSRRTVFRSALAIAVAIGTHATALAALPETVAMIKPSVVGVGTHLQTRSPAVTFSGTGFVVGDGLSIITNAHVVPDMLDGARKETLGVVVRVGDDGSNPVFRPATVVAVDRDHDLAHLRLSGVPLPALRLADKDDVREGQALAFTGFPLGMVLGLHPATHRAGLAAITPIVRPSLSARKLDARAIAQLQRAPFTIYQLDGTAYPGNSGSPVYDPETGVVVAVINMVFVKGLKENAITNPSGISYAIPARHVHALLQRTQ